MELIKQLNKIEEHLQIKPSDIDAKQDMKKKDKVSPGWWALAMSLRMLVKDDCAEREDIEGTIEELLDYFYHQHSNK
ncbi:hypothetical protein [Bacillus thuringiensis]|uniref:Uncharacterized protein n=1 Tax=Bacillus thuringiensis TaxID=1428 RepID=A0AAW9JHD5_BACTU|nr:hypothetical protein [Bacillus thuringiensis]MDZ5480038.1 hypothetical protein [Bacillus thuringiensis]